MSSIGRRIKERMEECHMSQYRLSKISGVAQSTISAIIADDQTRSPAVDTVEKLARALSCTASELMSDSCGQCDEKEMPAVSDSGLDEEIVNLLSDLSPGEVQRVQDFVAGLKASRKE